MVPSRLSAVLAGGSSITAGDDRPVDLDCSPSSDPDGGSQAGALAFAWDCLKLAGGPCLSPALSHIEFTTAAVQSVRLQAGAYRITCTVSKAGRSAAASARVQVAARALPTVSVSGLTEAGQWDGSAVRDLAPPPSSRPPHLHTCSLDATPRLLFILPQARRLTRALFRSHTP